MSSATPNHLLLTVIAARNLQTKSGSSRIDAFVSTKLETADGAGSRIEKVHTEVKRCSGSPRWEQTCEFSFATTDCILSLTVNHRTLLGTSECLGQIQFALKDLDESVADAQERWYPLAGRKNKPDDKYRGELLLILQLSHKSNSSQTLPASRLPVPKSSFKKKMSFGLRNQSTTTLSPDISLNEERRLSVPDAHQFELNKSMSSLSPIPKFFVRKSATMSADHYSSFLGSPVRMANDSMDDIFDEKSGNIETTALLPTSSPKVPSSYDVKAMDTRRSSQSSGFESARSAALHLVSTDWSNVELVYDTLTKEDLVELIKEQRVRLAQKERRIRDLEDYVDSLLARVMETKPDLLHAAPLHPPQRIRL